MPTYCTSTDVLNYLPDNPPSTVTDHLSDDIATASDLVESGVGPRFALLYKSNAQKFPDVTDSPATPNIVRRAATFYAASLQWLRLKESVGENETPSWEKYQAMAEQLVADIRNGARDVIVSGTNLRTTTLEAVGDPIYDDNDGKPFISEDELDAHL
jgi:hypothetical protein